jgi:hypothetical protein
MDGGLLALRGWCLSIVRVVMRETKGKGKKRWEEGPGEERRKREGCLVWFVEL